MSRQYSKYSPEFKDEAVKLVIDSSRPIAQVARELGVNEGTLGNWVNLYRKEHAGEEEPLTVSERARLLEQERELRELRMENEFLKKARSALRPGSPVVEKYEFIDSCPDDDAKYAYPVKKMCAWLSVSSSGFFDWQKRPQSATTARRERLALLIAAEFADSDETYGYRRIHARLARSGVHCGPELVRDIMRELGLRPCQPRPWRTSLTAADGRDHASPTWSAGTSRPPLRARSW